MASLIENASSDKSEVSEKIEEIKSSVALVETGLTSKLNHLAVSNIQICQLQDLILKICLPARALSER